MHADHFFNDCAYGSLVIIILDASYECIFIFSYLCVAFVTEGHMVE